MTQPSVEATILRAHMRLDQSIRMVDRAWQTTLQARDVLEKAKAHLAELKKHTSRISHGVR